MSQPSSPSSKLPLGVSIEDSSDIRDILLEELCRSEQGRLAGVKVEELSTLCEFTTYIVLGEGAGETPPIVLDRESPGLRAGLVRDRGLAFPRESPSMDRGERLT